LIVSSYAPGTWRLNVLDLSLGIVLLGIFVFAGLFAQIAGVTSVQPSIFLMAAALTLLGLSLAGGARRLPDFND
jgi:hypothetical protein